MNKSSKKLHVQKWSIITLYVYAFAVEEWNKHLKKIEKKLKQINLLEKKMEEGQALTDDEVLQECGTGEQNCN